jgi:hypothetical protein
MEFDNEVEAPAENEQVEIYSKRAIWGFSIFFSSIFGAVLLMINLRAAGFKKEANQILLYAILYTVVSLYIINKYTVATASPSSGAMVFNLVGGLMLSRYFFTKYFPDEDYYPKPIWKPLIISLLITGVFVGIAVLATLKSN